MSIFGGNGGGVNIIGVSTNVSESTGSVEITSLLLNLFDMIETIEDTIVDALLPKDEFGITPEIGFNSITVKGKYAPLLARRLYFQNGFDVLPTGTCDCRILERLYKEHPVLRLYSFELSEPRCCE